MIKLKAYTEKFGLVVSKEIRDDNHMCEAIADLCYHTKINKLYLTDGKQSREVNFIYTPSSTRPVYYTRSDGITVRTLSIHPHNYPMIAHFADSSTKVFEKK